MPAAIPKMVPGAITNAIAILLLLHDPGPAEPVKVVAEPTHTLGDAGDIDWANDA